MDRLEERIRDGKFRVNEDTGHIESLQEDGSWVPVGHKNNMRQNRYIVWRDGDNGVNKVPAQRVAWRLHRGEWPPDDMSVMMLNGDKGDFRRKNLALVPQGQENRLKAAMRRAAA